MKKREGEKEGRKRVGEDGEGRNGKVREEERESKEEGGRRG